jgi:hypothetical protein
MKSQLLLSDQSETHWIASSIRLSVRKRFPQEDSIVTQIFSYLNGRSVTACRLVCRQFKKCTDTNQLWKPIFFREIIQFPSPQVSEFKELVEETWRSFLAEEPQKSYREIYEAVMTLIHMRKQDLIWQSEEDHIEQVPWLRLALVVISPSSHIFSLIPIGVWILLLPTRLDGISDYSWFFVFGVLYLNIIFWIIRLILFRICERHASFLFDGRLKNDKGPRNDKGYLLVRAVMLLSLIVAIPLISSELDSSKSLLALGPGMSVLSLFLASWSCSWYFFLRWKIFCTRSLTARQVAIHGLVIVTLGAGFLSTALWSLFDFQERAEFLPFTFIPLFISDILWFLLPFLPRLVNQRLSHRLIPRSRYKENLETLALLSFAILPWSISHGLGFLKLSNVALTWRTVFFPLRLQVFLVGGAGMIVLFQKLRKSFE